MSLRAGGRSPQTDMLQIREDWGTTPSDGNSLRSKTIASTRRARYQGPILNLFQLEMTAKQLYPAKFGEWPTYAEGPYPEIPEDEQLFDRQAVADIIAGTTECALENGRSRERSVTRQTTTSPTCRRGASIATTAAGWHSPTGRMSRSSPPTTQ